MTSTEQRTKAKPRSSQTGVVKSVSGDKTRSVVVSRLVKHPKYGKYVRQRTKLAVHDPRNESAVGDVVMIVPCRRLSKSKSWRLAGVVRRAVSR